MIRISGILAALALSACANGVQTEGLVDVETGAAQKSAPASKEAEPVVLGHTYTISSDVLGADRRLTVRLPAGYEDNPDASYPVVYLIDGGPEQDFPHIAGITQSRDLNWTFAPFILVGVETVSRRTMLTPPAEDAAPYEEWLKATPGGSQKYPQIPA